MVSYVDGHISYIKIYWDTNRYTGGTPTTWRWNTIPPPGYDYQWSAD